MLTDKELDKLQEDFVFQKVTFEEIKKLHQEKKISYDVFNHFFNIHELRNMKMKF